MTALQGDTISLKARIMELEQELADTRRDADSFVDTLARIIGIEPGDGEMIIDIVAQDRKTIEIIRRVAVDATNHYPNPYELEETAGDIAKLRAMMRRAAHHANEALWQSIKDAHK